MTELIVLTGGPGAGKTAILEVVRRTWGGAVDVLPEAAGIIFSGGFPRRPSLPARRAAQRAIFHVQRQLELVALEERNAPVVLCDRGTLDGVAYWPGDPAEFWRSVGAAHDSELARYSAVIHLRTPDIAHGYNHQNPVRTESAEQAAEIDQRILIAWAGHPRRFVIPSSDNFVDKLDATLNVLRALGAGV